VGRVEVLRRAGGCERLWLGGPAAAERWHARNVARKRLPCGHAWAGAAEVPLADAKRAGYAGPRAAGLAACRACGDVAPPPATAASELRAGDAEAQAAWAEAAAEGEHLLKLQEECLALVVQLVTELPKRKTTKAAAEAGGSAAAVAALAAGASAPAAARPSGLERHLAHCLAAAGSAGATRSELAASAAPYFPPHDVESDPRSVGSDAALDAAIACVAAAPTSTGGGGSGRRFVLSAAGASLYDPCCPGLRREEHTKATEHVASLMARRSPGPSSLVSTSSGCNGSSSGSGSGNGEGWRPVVSAPPPAAPVFNVGVRRALLLSRTLRLLLASVLRRHGTPRPSAEGPNTVPTWCEPLVLLAIHLLTLAVHECAAEPETAAVVAARDGTQKREAAEAGGDEAGDEAEAGDRHWLHPASLAAWDARYDSIARLLRSAAVAARLLGARAVAHGLAAESRR
jgi:hypothetical protein